MARVILVHGAFNEFWGPHELKARWLPALRDGLWYHGVEIDDAEVEVPYLNATATGEAIAAALTE